MLGSILGVQVVGLLLVNMLSREYRIHRLINIIVSIITLYLSLYLLLVFNTNNGEYQYREAYMYTDTIGVTLGVDGISMTMLILLSILDPILILLSRGEVGGRGEEEKRITNYMMGMKIIMYILFMCIDILIFFIMYELVLIPIFLLITKYGSKYKYYIPRVEAGMRIMIYTIVGSLFMLVAIAYLYSMLGSTSNEILHLGILNNLTSPQTQEVWEGSMKYVWGFIFLAFLIKVPMYPLHTWLPLAHSDAPTIGSIILAALLLKLASYGILRYSIGIYTLSLSSHTSLDLSSIILGIYVLALISILYSSIIALRAIYDLKKIIAYSSIVHMNFSIFGFFSRDLLGLVGATYLIHTHALISSCLFLLVGILYKRYHTRYLPYYQGLAVVMPIYALLLMLTTFANISLPFCASFFAELYIIYSAYTSNTWVVFILLASLIFSSTFMIWLTNRLLFGTPSSSLLNPLPTLPPTLIESRGRVGEEKRDSPTPIPSDPRSEGYRRGVGALDITRIELVSLFPLLFLIFYLAFYPSAILTYLYLPLTLLL